MRGMLIGGLLLLCLGSVTLTADAATVDRVVAKLNEDIVTQSDLQQAAAEHAGEIRKVSYRSALKSDVLKEVFDRTLLIQAGKKFGDKLPEDDLRQQAEETVASIRSRFPSEKVFLKELAGQGSSLKEFKNEVYRRVTNDFKVYRAVTTRFDVSDSEAAEFRKESLSRGEHPVSLRLRQLGVQIDGEGKKAREEALAKVQRLLTQINAKGMTFADGVRKYSQVPGAEFDGGDLGFLSAAKLSSEVRQATEKLEPGQASAAVVTGNYASIFYVEEKRSARSVLFAKKFAKERTALLAELRRKAHLQVYDPELLRVLPKEYKQALSTSSTVSPAAQAAQGSR